MTWYFFCPLMYGLVCSDGMLYGESKGLIIMQSFLAPHRASIIIVDIKILSPLRNTASSRLLTMCWTNQKKRYPFYLENSWILLQTTPQNRPHLAVFWWEKGPLLQFIQGRLFPEIYMLGFSLRFEKNMIWCMQKPQNNVFLGAAIVFWYPLMYVCPLIIGKGHLFIVGTAK